MSDERTPEPSSNAGEAYAKNESQTNWWDDISRQSWEPELIISGVALYLCSGLPAFISQAYDYYRFNLVTNSESFELFGARLIYGMLVSTSYILIISLIVHFASRAFWVGLVGLRSVFPEGIRFDKLSTASELSKKTLKERYGSVDNMILKIDQSSSVMFSLCFLMVLLMLGISYVYLLFLITTMFGEWYLDEAGRQIYYQYGIPFLGILFLGLVVLSTVLGLKRFHENPSLARLQLRVQTIFSWLIFPFISYYLTYLTLIFQSNVNKKRFLIFGLFFYLLFFVSLFFILLNKTAPQALENRDFYSAHSPENNFNSIYYDNLRSEELGFSPFSIPSDVLRENELKVFIGYPSNLDLEIKEFCSSPELQDSLSKYQKRSIQDRHRLNCWSDFFEIRINGEPYPNLNLIFYSDYQEGQKGFVTYLSRQVLEFKEGLNTLSLHKKYPSKITKKEKGQKDFLYKIPFWFFEPKHPK